MPFPRPREGRAWPYKRERRPSGGRSARVSIRSLGDGRRATQILNKGEFARFRRRVSSAAEIGHRHTPQ